MATLPRTRIRKDVHRLRSGGSGLTRVLEITDPVARLQGEGGWNEADTDVDFVPLRPVPGGSGGRIGRVSVYRG